jgi:probable F420-dependent oxidoreductase
MEIGVYTFPTGYSADIVQLGQALEARGFESLFVPEHSHIPASRETPWPGGPELPREYSHVLDPFVALAVVAATTTRLRLGFGVCLVVQRDPITLAKQVASLDHLSSGRVEFGVGGGWNREEMRNHGTDPSQRWDILRERVLAVKTIWRESEAEFHGEFVDFDPIWSWPKPHGRLPVLVGGNGPGTFDRVLEYGDGWMPMNRGNFDALAARVEELRTLAKDHGREEIPVTIFGATPSRDALTRYAESGVARVLFRLPSVNKDDALRHLDTFAEVAADHLDSQDQLK